MTYHPHQNTTTPSKSESFRFWWKIGWISFGGPAAQIALLHDELVKKKKWISYPDFQECLNFCLFLPGPEAQQLATYLGYKIHGFWGGVFTGLLFLFPGLLCLFGISFAYVTWGNLPFVLHTLTGMQWAILAFILQSLINVAKKIANQKSSNSNEAIQSTKEPLNYLRTIANRLIFFVAVYLFIYFILKIYDQGILIQLFELFSKTAFITFGGAYAVIPYVSYEMVYNLGLLEEKQIFDGLGLGESTPGPLVLVLPFFGFVAGYLQSSSLLMGSFCFFISALATFLPSFLLIFCLAPLFEKIRKKKLYSFFNKLVTPIVLVMLAVLIYRFGENLWWNSGYSLLGKALLFLWIGLLAFGFYRWKWEILPVVLLSGIIGVVVFGA